MSQVIVSATTKDLTVSATVVAGQWEVAIEDSAQNKVSQKVDSPTATFDGVGPGNYTASVARLDDQGVQIGEKATATFNVPTPATQVIQVSDVVTVNVDTPSGGPV